MEQLQLVKDNLKSIFMKKIYYLIIVLLITSACEKDDDFFFDNLVTVGDIKLIRFRADHNTLLPNNTPTYQWDSAIYESGMIRDTSLIPADLLPVDLFHLVDDSGQEYPDFSFSTTDVQ